MIDVPADLPGHELVREGLSDLRAGRESEASLLVEMAAPRLLAVGYDVPACTTDDPGHRLYELISEASRQGAHSRYNALVAQMVSFARAAEHATSG